MGSFVTIIVIVIVLLVAAFVVTSRVGKANQRHQRSVEADPRALRYQPPPGQDPAVVVAALRRAGFTTTLDEISGGTPALLVTRPDSRGPDREEVRRVIAENDQVNFEGDRADVAARPRFEDE